jgi:hypothetical protein
MKKWIKKRIKKRVRQLMRAALRATHGWVIVEFPPLKTNPEITIDGHHRRHVLKRFR